MRALAVAVLSLCALFPSTVQSPVLVAHEPRHLSVFLTNSSRRVESPGAKPQTFEYKPGDFRWHSAPITHSIKNIGSTRFEAVGVDCK